MKDEGSVLSCCAARRGSLCCGHSICGTVGGFNSSSLAALVPAGVGQSPSQPSVSSLVFFISFELEEEQWGRGREREGGGGVRWRGGFLLEQALSLIIQRQHL